MTTQVSSSSQSQNTKACVSVLLPVKNEAANIGRCLSHLSWCDEVFVVDSQSTDGTPQIAEEMGAKVVQFYFNGTYPKKQNWALTNLPFRNEWILIVAADEVIPCELAKEIEQAVQSGKCDGYYLKRRFEFRGRWIWHCGDYPSYSLRLLRHRLGRYEKLVASDSGDSEVHEHIVFAGRTDYIKNDILHYPYRDIATWVEKHNRYSNWEAELFERFRSGDTEGAEELIGFRQRVKRWFKRIYLRLPLRFVFRFFYSYIWKHGFLDGRPGFILCVLLSFYDFLSWAKVYERRFKQSTS